MSDTNADLLSVGLSKTNFSQTHDDVIKWKHFPRYWPFVREIHRFPVNSPHKDQWRGALMFSLICVWINGWVNNRVAGDLRCHRAHYDVIVMWNRNTDVHFNCSKHTFENVIYKQCRPGGRLNIKAPPSYQYRYTHIKDKTHRRLKRFT